jgi:peptide/nickel transport system permease protein
MAGKQSERFDDVDWNEISEESLFNLSINTKLFLLSLLPVAGLYIYDYLYVGEREAVFSQLAVDLGATSAFETIGLTGNLQSLDYLFAFTLLLFACYLVLPLYQNPRMTAYYWREFKRNRPAILSLVWLGVVFVGGLLGPLVISPPEQNILMSHQPPVYLTVDAANVGRCVGELTATSCHGTWAHPLGTTGGGKDVFKTIVYGMQISMKIAFITTTIVATIGVTFGTVSAYAGGWVDEFMMRFTDIILSFPTLVFFLLILYIYGATLGMFIIVFSVFAWGGMARYVRSKALSIVEEEFVKSMRISGATTYRTVRSHIVPNAASSIITNISLLIPGFILAEAQLAFLGLGDSTLPSWGQLIASGRSDLAFAPWIVLAPGFVLFLTILAFNFLGDALLDALNPEADAESES